jgi:adenylate cyclase
MGQFILAGKAKPVAAFELVCRMEESTELQKSLCSVFARALDAFKRQSWNETIAGFREAAKIQPEDGPSLFYLDWCEKYKTNPPGDGWNGVIRLENK